jgi:hypothetical protein
MTTMLWTGTSRNGKTGNIPQGYVGETVTKSKASCTGCALLDTVCYHWKGSSQLGHIQMMKGFSKGNDYSLKHALTKSVRSAQYIRAAVGGDPSVFTREQVEQWNLEAKEEGFKGIIMYTHFPETKGSHLKGLSMGSVDFEAGLDKALEKADQLIADGWRVALSVPFRAPDAKKPAQYPLWQGETFTTPAGVKGVICPSQIKRGVTCNSCGLCNAAMQATPLIIFLVH